MTKTLIIAALALVGAACQPAPTPTAIPEPTATPIPPEPLSPLAQELVSSTVEGTELLLQSAGDPLTDEQRKCYSSGLSTLPVLRSPTADSDIRWLQSQPREVQSQSPINLGFVDIMKKCLTATQYGILTGYSAGRATQP